MHQDAQKLSRTGVPLSESIDALEPSKSSSWNEGASRSEVETTPTLVAARRPSPQTKSARSARTPSTRPNVKRRASQGLDVLVTMSALVEVGAVFRREANGADPMERAGSLSAPLYR